MKDDDLLQYMNAVASDRMIELLGRASGDPAVSSLLDAHGLRWRPALPADELERFTDWFAIAEQGIEFGFMDEAYLKAYEPALRRRLPLIFHEAIFYGRHPRMKPYIGDLPYALDFSLDRATVQRNFQGSGWPVRSYRRDVWELPESRLIVSYADGDACIADVICCLRETPWPPRGEPLPPHPPIAVIAALLGQVVDGDAFRQAFFPLGVAYELERMESDLVIDMRWEFGFDIHIGAPPTEPGQPPSSKGVFDSITFYRDRDLDARGWAGELPFGLSFDDTPAQALTKVPGKPLEHSDQHLSGSALWRFEGCSLHLIYSTLDNLVYRVTLFRKGLLPIGTG